MIGTTLGRYRIIASIGQGGMATVYHAVHISTGRDVALKVMHRAVALNRVGMDRFAREAQLIASLEHPHILPLYDYDLASDPPYLVMRYMPTGTLEDVLSRGVLPPAEALHLLRQIAPAVDYAHRHGVIHRDIKPSNLMIDADGNAFLSDFGVAHLMSSTERLTGSGEAVGTPGYMSPEQGLGQPIDVRADIYALGAMLFEMVTGLLPYTAETPMAVIYQHVTAPIPSACSIQPTLPIALDSVIARAMAKQPADRYPTAQALVDDLAAALGARADTPPVHLQQAARETIAEIETRHEAAVTPDVAGAPVVPRKGPRRWLWVVAGLVAIGGGLAAAVMGMQLANRLGSLPVQEPPATQAAASLTEQTQPPMLPTVTATTTAPPIGLPSPAPTGNGASIVLVQKLEPPGRLAQGITWDGSSLWVADNSGTLFQMDPEGRTLDAIPAPEVTPQGLVWSGEGFWLYTTNYGHIYHFRIEGQEAITLGSFESPDRSIGGGINDDLAWDGEHLWYSDRYTLYELDTSGNVLQRFGFGHEVQAIDWDGSALWVAFGEWPTTAEISLLDTAGNVIASFESPVYHIEGLAWGGNCLWAIGRDSASGDTAIYRLDVSAARSESAPGEQEAWTIEVASAIQSQTLPLYAATPATPALPVTADEGMVFVAVALILRSNVQAASLPVQEIRLTDGQGYTYDPVGAQSISGGFMFGNPNGTVYVVNPDPLSLAIHYTITGTGGIARTTTEVNVPAFTQAETRPCLTLVWAVPQNASGLQVSAPGVPPVAFQATPPGS